MAKYQYSVYMKEAGEFINLREVGDTMKPRAINLAEKWARENPDKLVFVAFFRPADGMHGYINRDGVDIVGKSWTDGIPVKVELVKNTVMVYKVTCTKAYMIGEQGTRFSLQPWGEDTAHYHGHDDGGVLYEIPDGFTVAESNAGGMEFYDANGAHCPLETFEETPIVGGQPLQRA